MMDRDLMYREWVAWRAVCDELLKAACAIDINEEPRLHAALVLWGESMAALRSTQDPGDRAEWLRQAELKAAHVVV